jgi:hypothetical protein
MNSIIHFSFQYTERDYVRAMRAHYASRLKPKLDAVVAVTMALLGIYFWHSLDSPGWGIGFICLSAVLALMLITAFGVIPKLVFRREPKFRDEYSLTFSPGGIHFRTAHIDSQLQWSMYSRALVDAHSFILYHGTNSFTVIPKRVFETAEQLALFEHLISEKIPEVLTKGS